MAEEKAVILGRQELTAMLNRLPGRVVQKIMDDWTITQARRMARLARASAPRDKKKPRRKPESARLWRVIRASKVKSPQYKFKQISRAISFGARGRGAPRYVRGSRIPLNIPRGAKKMRRNARKPSAAFGPPTPRAGHFVWSVRGTNTRIQKTTKRNVGRMYGRNPNPQYWLKATKAATAIATGEVGQQLRISIQRGIDAELRALKRRYS